MSINILGDCTHGNVTVCKSRIQKLDINVSTECYFCVGFLVVSVGVTFFGGYLIFKCCVSTRCAFLHSGFSCCLMSKCFSAYMQSSQYMYHSSWYELNLALTVKRKLKLGGRRRLPVEQWDTILSYKLSLDQHFMSTSLWEEREQRKEFWLSGQRRGLSSWPTVAQSWIHT